MARLQIFLAENTPFQYLAYVLFFFMLSLSGRGSAMAIFCRKHARAMEAEGLANTGARLFSNPAGDYGSMVNERIGASNWEDGKELGDTWASRNAFSYGRYIFWHITISTDMSLAFCTFFSTSMHLRPKVFRLRCEHSVRVTSCLKAI